MQSEGMHIACHLKRQVYFIFCFQFVTEKKILTGGGGGVGGELTPLLSRDEGADQLHGVPIIG